MKRPRTEIKHIGELTPARFDAHLASITETKETNSLIARAIPHAVTKREGALFTETGAGQP